jgi:predicted glycoside hydrolase/deacetylase ChbG (UPF0249 family)
MQPNPILRQLGFSEKDRVLIIHADDIGMCQAGVAAMEGLMNAGIVSSMAAMTVCPWFPAAAAFARAHPGIDLGLHFTLTSEWDAYRWGPLSTRDPASGLIDANGYFYAQSEPPQKNGKAAAAQAELRAQIRHAQSAGIDLTHVDSHMLTAWHPKFLPAYLQLPEQCGLPSFFMRTDKAAAIAAGRDEKSAAFFARWSAALEKRGMPLFDNFFVMPLENADDRIGAAQRAMAALPPGLTYFILHPAVDSPELRAIAPDWRSRVADYQAFTSSALRNFIKRSGIQVIGWRTLRDGMRKKTGRR